MNVQEFIESVYEIAFGDDAIHKGYEDKEVLAKLMEFSNLALVGEKILPILEQFDRDGNGNWFVDSSDLIEDLINAELLDDNPCNENESDPDYEGENASPAMYS